MRAQLEHVRVRDCMHTGILGCEADAPLGEVAGMMATHRVHAVAVNSEETGRPVGVISDLDVVSAIVSGEDLPAARLTATEPLAVSAEDSLSHAAQLMAEHEVAHLVVLDRASGYPIGVLSTIDIASVYAGSAPEVGAR